MNKEEKIKVRGVVIEALPNMTFTVELETGQKIFAYLCGKMRMNYIKVLRGDKVVLEISPYDLTKGRIIRRER